MPIKITDTRTGDEVAWLSDESWDIPDQIEALEEWLNGNKMGLKKSEYIADLGFMPRPDAAGGGAALTVEMMELMVALGVGLHLSEYPPDDT